jgi:hypothetical protein
MNNMKWLLIATPLALAATGCLEGSDGGGTAGELGEGSFTYECELIPADPVCADKSEIDELQITSDLGTSGELPFAVAVGGRFDLSYFGDVTTDDLTRLQLHIVPAKTEHVNDKGGFSIDAPGRYAFLARDAEEGVVADFVYLDAAEATDLKFWSAKQTLDPTAAVDLVIGEADFNVAVTPVDADGRTLAGALSYQWSSSDEMVLVLDGPGSSGEPTGGVEINEIGVRAVAVGEGTVTITITAGTLSAEINVNVTMGATP